MPKRLFLSEFQRWRSQHASASTTPTRQAYQGGQAQVDSRELMGRCVTVVACAYGPMHTTAAVRERGRRMTILVCLPEVAIPSKQTGKHANQKLLSLSQAQLLHQRLLTRKRVLRKLQVLG